jgi:hypothetical protein
MPTASSEKTIGEAAFCCSIITSRRKQGHYCEGGKEEIDLSLTVLKG